MTTSNTELDVLQDPLALELLGSREMAQLAYTWPDGTARVVPIWFHWNGSALVLGTPPRAPKLKALASEPRVSVTIEDSSSWPYKVLLMRGTASVEMLDGVSPEYESAARRYFGDEQAAEWVNGLRDTPMARITIEPQWARVLDFVTRFPSALSM
jgi:pyridoxamine 5'-phosphate oxidase-like protein